MRLPDAVAEHIGDRRLVPVAGGQSGAEVLRTDDGSASGPPALYLKVGTGEAARLVAAETERLRWVAGRVPVARLVASGSQGRTAWFLSEALPGLTIGAWIKQDRTRAVLAAEKIAEFVRHLQALPTGDCPFDSSVAAWLPEARRLVAEGRIDVTDFDIEHDGWSAERVLQKVEALAHHAQGSVIVHGDLSLGNLVIGDDGDVVGCLDVGRLGVGDPYRDIFIGWRDLSGFGEDGQRAFLAALGMERFDEARRDLHRALDELF